MAGVVWGWLAAGLSMTGYIWYGITVLRGRVQPERRSWLIWAAQYSVLLVAHEAKAAVDPLWLVGAQTLGVLVIFELSLVFGVGRYGRKSVGILAGVGAGLVAWGLTSNPTAAIVIALLIELTGAVFTLRHSYRHPDAEPVGPWVLFAVAGLAGLPAVGSEADFGLYLYPVALMAINAAVVVTVMCGRRAQTRLLAVAS